MLVGVLGKLGQPPFTPRSPAGFADDAASWNGPDALWKRVQVAQSLARIGGDPDPQAVVDSVPSVSEVSVVMVDVVTQRERACAVYGALRTALAANDLEASLRPFTTHQQEALRPIVTALGSNRAVFAARLGTIANGVIGLHGAELTILRTEEGLPVAYPLGIAAGADGVWRITSF